MDRKMGAVEHSPLATIEEADVEEGSFQRSSSMENPAFYLDEVDEEADVVPRPDALQGVALNPDRPVPELMSPLDQALRALESRENGAIPEQMSELSEHKPSTTSTTFGPIRKLTARLSRNFSPNPRRLSVRELEDAAVARTRRRLTETWIDHSTFNTPVQEVRANEEMDPPPSFEDVQNVVNSEIQPQNADTISTNIEEQTWEVAKSEHRWMNNKEAKSAMYTILTAFYCLFLTIFALVLELAHLLSDEKERKVNTVDWIFGLFMYGTGICFFFYMYSVLLLNPRWFSSIGGIKKMLRCSRKTSPESSVESQSSMKSAAATIRMVSHTSPSAGSLFLRLGCVAFGVVGVVYYAFLVFLCFAEPSCSRLQASLDICAIVFIFTQMHYIFCNWKAHTVARLGTMHLIAANLWTWIRYILMEEGVMEKEIREVFKTLGNKTMETMGSHEKVDSHESGETFPSDYDMVENFDLDKCKAAECILGSLSEVMYTAIVEYSLIGAAVIDQTNDGVKAYVKRKHQIRVDCSKTTTGLFLGLAFLATSFSSMVVYYGLTSMRERKKAAFIYAITDIIQYSFSTIGCCIAIYQMRKLHYYSNHRDGKKDRAHTELLDQILLCLGLVGELIYSVAGLVGLTGENSWAPLAFVLLIVHIFRIMQVGLQTFLLYMAGRVRVSGADRITQPGKQAVTFLLVANVAIFFMNLFESEKAGVSEIIIDFYGKRSWVFLVRSFSPLTIFFRFHSSVCLAEIWKNVYARKD